MPMRRREKHITGAVKFPVDDPRFENTKEGGMFVRAMVTEPNPRCDYNRHNETCWMECCGGTHQVQRDETLLGGVELERKLWPRLFDANGDPRGTESHEQDYLSVPCLAVINLGSTGWSGWVKANKKYWVCTEEDLTGAGRRILENLRDLYPGREIHLTTWLDT